MGNYISCTLSMNTGGKNRVARVILPNGEIQQFDEPIKAAELMFETPNYFLVNSRSLQIGRRFSALNADEDLEMGHVYIMFPMKRVNSIIKASDMGVLLITANSAAKRNSSGKIRILSESVGVARVTPETVKNMPEKEVPMLNFDDIEDCSVNEFKNRLSLCRSRKPLLETITEEPVYAR